MSITKTTSSYNPETKKFDKQTSTFAEGTTIRVWYESVQVMSDVWESACHASYWDEAAGRVRTEIWVQATVDASPDVLEKVFASIYAYELEKAINTLKAQAARPSKGSVVKVVSGRGTPRGKQGRIEVIITRPYGMGYRSAMREKYGIATSDVKVDVLAANGKVYSNYRDMIWVWAHNVELVSVPEIDMDDAKARALSATNYIMKSYDKAWSRKEVVVNQ
jgi:hypothetical protein